MTPIIRVWRTFFRPVFYLVPLIIPLSAPAAAADVSFEVSGKAAPRPKPGALPYGPAYAEEAAVDPYKGAAAVGSALDSAAGVDVQRRGAPGSQGDISIRGSSFQQGLLLVDGMRMNDPQTAHHNLDLPLSAEDIERVDVLRGPFSSVYGPDAFAGAVNIVTRRPDRDRITARLEAGDFSTWSSAVSCDRKWKNFGQRVSLEKSESGGFREGTDHRSGSLSSRSALELPWGGFDLSLGYIDKDFGASRFYSTATSGERETTGTRSAGLSARFGEENSLLAEPRIYFRRHNDRFGYVFNSVSYTNRHITETAGGELRLRKKVAGLGVISAGGEYSDEGLDSSSMGDRSAFRKALFAQFAGPLGGGVELDASLRGDRHSSWGWQASPGLRLGYKLSSAAGVWAMAGRSFRAPSFTELYYKDPGNTGNAGLKPEKSVSYELGADWKPLEALALRTAVYRRDETDLIDWTKQTPSAAWAANNIGRMRVWGFENALESGAGALRAMLKYSYIRKRNGNEDYISKYALRYARHKAALGLKYRLPRDFDLALDFSAVRRVGEKGYVLADARLGRKCGAFDASIGATNFLDADYEEIPGAPAPGRWLRVSLGYSF